MTNLVGQWKLEYHLETQIYNNKSTILTLLSLNNIFYFPKVNQFISQVRKNILHAIIKRKLDKGTSNALRAFTINGLFLSFCESSCKPNAVDAITSMVYAPTYLKEINPINYQSYPWYRHQYIWKRSIINHIHGTCISVSVRDQVSIIFIVYIR